MKYAIKFSASPLLAAAAVLLLSSCGGREGLSGGPQTGASSGPVQAGGRVISDFPVKIGAPYQIGGKNYTPEDVANYDEVGYASYYGAELAGRPTANGEIFNPAGITAAHKTLPLPSYVEVTALETGRTILVRINDRGPFANDRAIDLSEGAARQLGILQQGVAGVRIRKVNPAEQERAALRSGSAAAVRLDTPESLLKILRKNLAVLPRPAGNARSQPSFAGEASPQVANRPGAVPAASARNGRFIREGAASSANARPSNPPRSAQPAPQSGNGRFIREGGNQSVAAEQVGVSGNYVVQLSAFSSRPRAEALARKLGANVAVSSDGGLFRVRYGPYASEQEAQTGLAKAQQRGYPQAKIFRE